MKLKNVLPTFLILGLAACGGDSNDSQTIGSHQFEGAGIPVDVEVPVFTPTQRQEEKDLAIEQAFALLSGN